MFCLNGTMLELLLMYMDLNKLEGANVVDGRLREVLGNFSAFVINGYKYSDKQVESNKVG